MIWSDYTKELDSKIREGQIAWVRSELAKLRTQEIPRDSVSEIANIARRVQLETWGLQLLKPIIRPPRPVHPPPNLGEWTVYAALLIKLGAIREALEILESQPEQQDPSVLLYTAFAHVAEWNYELAIPIFKKYLAIKDLDPYRRTIAGVNLASALEFTKHFDQAEPLLKQLMQDCLKNQWNLLLSNCCEILAQVKLHQGQWSEIAPLLDQAQAHTSGHSHYQLFINKWRCIAQLLQSPKSEIAQQELKEMRKKAVELRNWENVRECDFYEAVALGNVNLLTHVYFGTPMESYKNRIRAIFKIKKWTLENTYIWKPFPGPSDRLFDMMTLQGDFGEVTIKPGQLLHRFLILLCSDFYQSFSVGTLFSKLFPDEYFNTESSPDRIFQAVKQLREWFQKNQMPLDIVISEGQYQMTATGAFAFRLTEEIRFVTSDEFYLKQLHKHFQYKSFSASQAADLASVSVTRIREVLNGALEKKRLYVSGKGRSTLYRFEE